MSGHSGKSQKKAEINCDEEQNLELECLQSICVGEFELITDSPITYEVEIKADRDDDDYNFISVKLKIEYTENYPKVLPKSQFKNLTPKYLLPIDFANCDKIFKKTADHLLGEQMMYEIIENVREFLREKNEVFVKEKLREEEERRLKEENKGIVYVAEKKIEFNKDTFKDWLKKFSEERERNRIEALKNRTREQIERDDRLTGKAYFQQKEHIAGSGIVFDDDDIDKIIDNEVETEELDENEEEKEKEYFDEELFDDDGEDIDLGDEQYFD